jgi:ABC-type transport system substrate-binding protein
MAKTAYKVSREGNIRQWTYTAHLSVTGKLLRITAGCRTWKTFEDAFAHYHGEGPYKVYRWSDQWVAFNINQQDYHIWREESRAILGRLSCDVLKKTNKIRAKRRKAR